LFSADETLSNDNFQYLCSVLTATAESIKAFFYKRRYDVVIFDLLKFSQNFQVTFNSLKHNELQKNACNRSFLS